MKIFERYTADGAQHQLYQGSDLITSSTVDLGMRVIKDKIECLVNGAVVAYVYGADSSLSSGGIGLGTWSESGIAPSVLVHSVSASVYNSSQEYSQRYDIIASTIPPTDQSDSLGGANPEVKSIVFPTIGTTTPALTSDPSFAQSVPVLLYHELVTKTDGVNITIANFNAQMVALKNAGWHSISIYDYNDFIQGKKKLPPKSVLITFDDGRKDSWVGADPILKQLGFQATMFAIVDRIDINQNSQLSLIDLQTMNASGRWQIQSHGDRDHDFYILDPQGTNGHFLSNEFWLAAENRFENPQEFQARISTDLMLAKNTLQNEFGKPVIAFAYPFSDYGEDTANFPDAENIVLSTVQSMYSVAFYQTDPNHDYSFDYPDPGQFMQKRILVDPSWTGADLVDLLSQNEAKVLPFGDGSFDSNAWLQNWGQSSVSNNSIDLKSASSTTGSLIYLSGSELWSNYNVQATVNWIRGASFEIVARLRNDQNYEQCVFDGDEEQIVEYQDGKEVILQQGVSPNMTTGNTYNLGMRVYGNEVSCTMGNQDIATTLATPAEAARGNIGFATWDATPGNSEVAINNIHVTPVTTDIAMLPAPLVVSSVASSTQPTPTSIVSDLSIPYTQNNFGNNTNWQSTWGTMTVESSTLMGLGANVATTGSSAILANTEDWTDYQFNATFDWTKGQEVGLIGRYVDDNNYLVCAFESMVTFGEPGVTIDLEQYTNGVQRTLETGAALGYNGIGDKDISAYIKTRGSYVTCSFNGQTLPEYDMTIYPAILKGGIGFTTWDPALNNSEIVVKNVNVEGNYYY